MNLPSKKLISIFFELLINPRLFLFFILTIAMIMSHALVQAAPQNQPTDANVRDSERLALNRPNYLIENFSHLNWSDPNTPKIKVKLNPLTNYSGIPIGVSDSLNEAEYFTFGKLPSVMNEIAKDSLVVSRHFLLDERSPDYQIEWIIEKYQLPYDYSLDEQWWNQLRAKTDRYYQKPKHAIVKLSIKISSAQKQINPWMDSVEVQVSACDLNTRPQPPSWLINENKNVQRYLTSTPGQAFLTAANYLTVSAIRRLSQQPQLARVTEKMGNELYLTSDATHFTQGETLALYYHHFSRGKSFRQAGSVKVIKVFGQRALAYPLDLRGDHIKVGDWVELSGKTPFSQPISTYVNTAKCADVSTIELASD